MISYVSHDAFQQTLIITEVNLTKSSLPFPHIPPFLFEGNPPLGVVGVEYLGYL